MCSKFNVNQTHSFGVWACQSFTFCPLDTASAQTCDFTNTEKQRKDVSALQLSSEQTSHSSSFTLAVHSQVAAWTSVGSQTSRGNSRSDSDNSAVNLCSEWLWSPAGSKHLVFFRKKKQIFSTAAFLKLRDMWLKSLLTSSRHSCTVGASVQWFRAASHYIYWAYMWQK